MWPFTRKNTATHIARVDAGFSVAGQIGPAQVEELAALGFKVIVCARPDGEETGQPSFADVAAAAERNGLTAVHIPMTGLAPSPEQVARFRRTVQGLPGPVLGYCRSGARAASLRAAASR